MKFAYLLLASFACVHVSAQPSIRTFNWKDAGYKGPKPVYTPTYNIMNYGGNNNQTGANDAALASAIAAMNNIGGVIYFPPGVYSFTSPVSLNRDSITFAGAGHQNTTLVFNLNGLLNNCFNAWGTQVNSDTSSFAQAGIIDSSKTTVLNASAFQAGDWVHLTTTDNAYMFSSWAYGSLGQVMQVNSVQGNTITFKSPFRFYYTLALKPKIRKLNPRKAIGFECLHIRRNDATSQQTSLISFDKAVQCWANGIEGDSTNYAHVELSRACNVEITNSWFHLSHAYGGSGQGYGIALQYSSSECKIENNIFNHLRHSILFQAGANGNVAGYNYSYDPYWNEGIFPNNSAGDIVLHGNYPFANLIEGNINQNTVIDNSHAKSGPNNTFFRNRSQLYGLFMNNSPSTDTLQFLGLEITGQPGFYTISGNGHLQHGNRVQGVLTPGNTGTLNEASLYYSGAGRPLCFTPAIHTWPMMGVPNAYTSGSNAAYDRFLLGEKAVCNCTNLITGRHESQAGTGSLEVHPNPGRGCVKISSLHTIINVKLFSLEGKEILNVTNASISEINTSHLPKGIYILQSQSTSAIYYNKLVVE